ncbi:MAG: ECF-type sigma factor [Pirellulaceae bacterium]|jgi:RNA polymerase sigma factor (TIGR02999 family)|nr:ECF-type sigma factor [Pirellulaceae bacterium]MDP6721173.1 ECF-type sigma factor [Pirellulaceae bacterium]
MCNATNVTQILNAFGVPNQSSSEQLLPIVYRELRRLAAQRLTHEKPGQTLQATALVHEAYVRLVDSDHQQRWDSRGHFFAAAAEAMRRILVENARRKKSLKHGGDLDRQRLAESQIAAVEADDDLLALDEALDRLAETDPQAVELVKLRYFSGLTIPQVAEALDISSRSADRLWAYAKAWLHDEMQGE